MINVLSLAESTILVTGASSGIGRETSILLSQLGAKVILVGRNQDRLAVTFKNLAGDGHQAECFDLSAVDDIPNWMKRLARTAGPLDGVVHAAGTYSAEPLRTVSSAQIEALMRVNLGTAVALAQGFRLKGVNRYGGSLVFLSSVSALSGQPGVVAYSASKGAISAATRSLARELARENIRVNCIAPGMVLTEMAEGIRSSVAPEQWQAIEKMHPLGFGQPRDIAHAAAFLLAKTGRWITGTTLVVDGGYTA